MNKHAPRHNYAPFKAPLIPPPEGLTENICIQCDAKWKPYILTMLMPLVVDRTWESDAQRAKDEASLLITQVMLSDCQPAGNPEEGDCVDYTPQNAPIWWGPINPFINPYDVPNGYLLPPWTKIPELPDIFEGISGLQGGDVLTTPLSFPILVPPLHPDITKFRVYCFGTGVVELHLLQIPFGGVALITQDDNILTLVVVELNREIQVPPTTTALIIQEVEFTTGGSHHIDVTFERRLSGSFDVLGFGGGLRKVVLCGFDLPGESVDVRQNVDAPCTLEKSADGETWVPFADLQLCPPKIRTDKGKLQIQIGGIWIDLSGGGDERFDGSAETPYPDPIEGETGNCLAAENITAQFLTMLTQLHNGLLTGAIATLGGTIAASLAAVVLFPIALIGAAVLGIVSIGNSIGAAAVEAITESADIDTLKCIISCEGASDGSFNAGQFEIIKDQIESQIGGSTAGIMFGWLDSLGPVGMTRLAASAGITEGSCVGCDCGWSYLWDFEVDSGAGVDPDYSWQAFFGYSTYVAAQGWTSSASDNYLTLPNAGAWTYCTFSINVNEPIGGTNHSDILNADYSVNLLSVGLTAGTQTTSLPGPLDPPRTDGVGIETYNAAGGQTIITGCRIDGTGTPPPFVGGAFV